MQILSSWHCLKNDPFCVRQNGVIRPAAAVVGRRASETARAVKHLVLQSGESCSIGVGASIGHSSVVHHSSSQSDAGVS